ncbi:MAG: Cthe_2314 family HEPN domain-containing protein [Rhodanobacter sp.]
MPKLPPAKKANPKKATSPDFASPFDPILLMPFIKETLGASARVLAVLGDRPARLEPELDRDPDEHEFFMLNVGASLSHLLTCCEHLRATPVFLANYRSTPSLRSAGLGRHTHVVLHVESYLIRVRGVLDRVLQVVNAVFHLCNDSRTCSEHVILKNKRVEHHPDVVVSVKKLKKVLDRYSAARNEVVHSKPYMEQRLRHAEMYELAERWHALDDEQTPNHYAALKNELLRDIVQDKKLEFETFNTELAALLKTVMNALAPCYKSEEEALRLRVGKVSSST